MKLRYAGTTHVGVKRKHNEDTFLLAPEERLYTVADGMGGHACGEVASQLSIDTVGAFFQSSSEDDELTWPCKAEKSLTPAENRMTAAVKLANLRIYEKAQSVTKYKGMGTTIVVVFFHEGYATLAHVGDSRIYRLRDDSLTLLTEDHSLLNDYKKMANLTEEEERNFPHKNIIVRALGMKEDVEVDVQTDEPQEGDVYLLCSDGLTGEVEDDEIKEILQKTEDIEEACSILIERACENGGKDNVTAVLVHVAA